MSFGHFAIFLVRISKYCLLDVRSLSFSKEGEHSDGDHGFLTEC